MRALLTSVFVATLVLATTAFPLFGENSKRSVPFTPHQMHEFIAIRNSYKDDTYRLASVAFTVHNAETLYTAQPSALARAFDPPPYMKFDEDYSRLNIDQFIRPVTIEDGLRKVAAEKAARLDNVPGGFAKSVDEAVDGLASVGGVWGKGLKIAYPSFKEAVVGRSPLPEHPNLTRKFVVEWTTWACDEVRKGTPAGRILAPYVSKYLGVNPKNDLRDHPDVRQGTEALKAGDKRDGLTEAVGVTKFVQEANEALQSVRQWQKEKGRSQELERLVQERADKLEDSAAGFAMIGRAFAASGNQKLGKTFSGLAIIGDKLSSLVAKGPKVSSGSVVLSFFSMADTFQSILQKENEISPYPALFSALQELSNQINDFRNETLENFANLDQRVKGGFVALDRTTRATNYSTEEARLALAEVRRAIDDMQAHSAIQFSDLAGVIFRNEESACISLDGKGNRRPLSLELFQHCRDVYTRRATIDAASSVAEGTLDRDVRKAGSLDALRQAIDPEHKEYSSYLVNPDVWYWATTRFLELFQSNPDKLTELSLYPGTSKFPQLDEVIGAGQNIEAFSRTALIDEKNKLKRQRLQLFIDRIVALRTAVLSKIEEQIENKSVDLDPTLGLLQPYDKTFPFELLSKPIGKCTDWKREFVSFNSYYYWFYYPKTGGYEPVYNGRVTPETYARVLSLFKSDFQKLDTHWLTLDPTFVQALPNYLPLLEQFDQQSYVLAPCLAEITVSNLTTTSQAAEIDIDMKVEVWINRLKRVDRIKAITLHGPLHAKVDVKPGLTRESFLSIKGDTVLFSSAVFPAIWLNAVVGKFDKILKPINDQEAISVRQGFEGELSAKLSSFRDRQKSLVRASVIEQEKGLAEARHDLLRISNVGLDNSLPSTRNWFATIGDDNLFPSPSQIIDDVFSGTETLERERSQLDTVLSRLNSALDELSNDPQLRPGPDLYENRLNELRKLGFLRSLADRATKPTNVSR
ncbi:hypothetical protein OZ411_22415 [Bradyrhizobium sp. Arg237L]|uniref:hypothetical protein n=1 Tax=Bradyrhizobium sp. Arg237L TaxID=3003352 RepID=UPI00249E5D39|nr:hypothetical protein [Bradyrhizobium sp. Arg237L]MDI4235565.1 hypothetical protein [Bradyrhizobium sp. Arg237L]